MKLSPTRLMAFVLILAGLAAADGPSLEGKWKGQMQAPNGGPLVDISFDFHVAGEKLTGTVSSEYGQEQISDGVVKGEDVSFVVNAQGGQIKITYKGKAAGDDLKLKVTLGDYGDAEFTANRVH